MGFLSPTELGKRLGYTRQQIHNLIVRGLVKVEKVGRYRAISEKEAERLVRKFKGKYKTFERKRNRPS